MKSAIELFQIERGIIFLIYWISVDNSLKNQGAGYNVLRYLLHHMNNRVIKEQYHESYKKNYNTGRWEYLGANNWLSNLYLANECLPFDTMPFCSGLRKHVPNISDLLIALDTAGREHEFMARVIKK